MLIEKVLFCIWVLTQKNKNKNQQQKNFPISKQNFLLWQVSLYSLAGIKGIRHSINLDAC